jgi:hypothetical protein
MDLRIDEKGKYYTARITKDVLAAVVRTTDQIIVGHVHVRPEHRLKDELDGDRSRFLAMTEASVYAAEGDVLLYRTHFLLVAYQHMITITPIDALSDTHTAPWLAHNGKDRA